MVWQTIQNSQIARHAFGDAHGDALRIAEHENHEPRPKVLCSANLDFLPRDAERRVADTKKEENGQIETFFRGGHTDYAAVMSPKAHIYSVEKWTSAPGLAKWFRQCAETPGERKPTTRQTNYEANTTPKRHEKDHDTIRSLKKTIEAVLRHTPLTDASCRRI